MAEKKISKRKQRLMQEAREARRKRVIITLSVISALAVLLGVLLGVLIAILGKRADYLSDDLSRYVTVPDGAYRGVEIKINKLPPSDSDFSERAMLDLIDFRSSDELTLKTSGRLGVGDTVKIKSVKIISGGKEILSRKDFEHVIGAAFKIDGVELSGVNFGLEGREVELDSETELCTELTVAYLPYDYADLTLAATQVTAKFEIEGFIDYTIPLINDEFVEKQLGIAEKIKDFEGEGTAEKYFNSLRAELDEEYEAALEYLTEELIWERLISASEIKRLPRGDLRDVRNALVRAGLDEEEAERQAERTVAMKLILYSVLRKENWLLPEGELAEIYNGAVDQRLADYLKYEVLCLREHYATEEEYNAAVASHRADLIASYGEDFFTDEAYLRHLTEKIKTVVKITKASK